MGLEFSKTIYVITDVDTDKVITSVGNLQKAYDICFTELKEEMQFAYYQVARYFRIKGDLSEMFIENTSKTRKLKISGTHMNFYDKPLIQKRKKVKYIKEVA